MDITRSKLGAWFLLSLIPTGLLGTILVILALAACGSDTDIAPLFDPTATAQSPSPTATAYSQPVPTNTPASTLEAVQEDVKDLSDSLATDDGRAYMLAQPC